MTVPPSHECCYIINLDDGSGTHWTAVYIKNKRATYCDSYGQIPPPEVIRFLKKYRIKYEYNYSQIQALSSTACGWYCVAFLWCMNNGYTLSDFIAPFNETTQTKNDKVLQGIVKRIF